MIGMGFFLGDDVLLSWYSQFPVANVYLLILIYNEILLISFKYGPLIM